MVFKKGHKINVGRKYSSERNKKISISKTGKKMPDNLKIKLSKIKKEQWKNPEYKKMMSDAHKGQKTNTNGLREYWRTHKKTEEHILKLKENHCRGKNHPNYKGGKTKYNITKNEWQIIKERILQRDNYTCRECGKDLKKYRFNIHHKKPYRISKDNSDNNLISYCVPCHIKNEYN